MSVRTTTSDRGSALDESHGGFALEASDGSGKGATEIRKNRPAHAQHIVYMLATDYPPLPASTRKA